MITISGGSTTVDQIPSDVPSDRGYLAWSLPMSSASNFDLLSAVATAGRLALIRVRRVPAAAITNIVIGVPVAGATLTAGQCGAALYDTAGNRLGVTGDQSTAWQSTGVKVMPISGGPVTNPSVRDLYVGLWWNGTTAPRLMRGTGADAAITNAGTTSPNLVAAISDSGITTTPPNPFVSQTAAYAHWWVALS